MKLTIKGILYDLNSYIADLNSSRYSGNSTKQSQQRDCVIQLTKYKSLKLTGKYHFGFTWYCKDKKKDPDNIAFAKKVIMDSLVKSGMLPNDGWKNVGGFTDEFEIDKGNERVEIEITEV